MTKEETDAFYIWWYGIDNIESLEAIKRIPLDDRGQEAKRFFHAGIEYQKGVHIKECKCLRK